jgi:hypothetical protein
LGPIISRLETLATHESANQKLLSAVVRHWRKRCEMPRSRLARVPVVLSELVSLRYWRFSAGITTAAKDLIFVR